MAKEQAIREELLIWGYVRQIQSEYKIENIPVEINGIILLFKKLQDKWSEKYLNRDNEIHEETKLMTNLYTSKCYSTAYGDSVVDDGIFKWRLKIMSLKYPSGYEEKESPYIGIIEDDTEHLERYKYDVNWDDYGYQLHGLDGSLHCYIQNYDYIQTSDYCCKWNKKGDILEITLDLHEQTLSFKMNDKDHGVAYSNIKPTKYRLALTTSVPTTIEML